jgi:hypothetical protein
MAQIAVEVGVLGLVVPSCKKHHLLQYRGTRQLGRNHHHHHHGCVVYNACYARVCFCSFFPFLPPSTLFVLLLLFLQFSTVSAGSEKMVWRDGSGWWWWQKRIAVVCSQQQKGPANTKNNATAATKVAEKAILEERSIPAAGPLSRQPLQQEVRCCCSVCPLSLADCSFPDIMLEWISNIVC